MAARKRKRNTNKRGKLLKRVERLARTAAALRLHGNVDRAMSYDKKLNSVMDEAERLNIADKAFEKETKGTQRGDKLYHKIVKRRK
jgi:hypothetical protein